LHTIDLNITSITNAAVQLGPNAVHILD